MDKTYPVAAREHAVETIEVLEQLLAESIRLRDLHMNARWQVSDGRYSEIRQMLNEHHKEQLTLIGLLVDRIRILGGAARVFASDFLRRAEFCHVIRGPEAVNQLLLDRLEAHEAVLSAAHPHDRYGEPHWARDCTVGRVVLTNEQQWDTINAKVLIAGPQRRLLATDTSRLQACE